MSLESAYGNLEQRFRGQVEMDKAHTIERVVQGWGVYLPSVEPADEVDYIFVGMEPSFGNWADSIEDARRQIGEGVRNYGLRKSEPPLPSWWHSTVGLFVCSIERFLCKPGETYHLTDASKGAMPVTVADLDRDHRWEAWYPLLLEEIEIVGKPSAPIIAIGKRVERFLKKRGLKKTTGRPLQAVPHYSNQASAHFKREADNDRQGFEKFEKAEFGENSCWPADLSPSNKQLIFAYKK